MRIASLLAALGVLAGCAVDIAETHPVGFSLQNAGATPISCRLIYGHWVERDYGEIPPGATRTDDFRQQGDGGLFTLRPDGRARMMIETVQCAQFPDWLGTVGQVDFAAARRAKAGGLAARCAMPPEGGRIVCEPLEIEPAP